VSGKLRKNFCEHVEHVKLSKEPFLYHFVKFTIASIITSINYTSINTSINYTSINTNINYRILPY